jgi:hypothetical protein
MRTPVTFGSYFGGWPVTWLGGWTPHQQAYLGTTLTLNVAEGANSVGSAGGSTPLPELRLVVGHVEEGTHLDDSIGGKLKQVHRLQCQFCAVG